MEGDAESKEPDGDALPTGSAFSPSRRITMGRLSAADEKQIRSSGSNDRDGSQDRHRLLHHGEEPGRIRSRDLGQKGQPTSKTDGEETPPAGAADGLQTGAHRRKTSSVTYSIQGAGMGVPRESSFDSAWERVRRHCGVGYCPQSGPKSDDPGWPAHRQCGRTPNPSFRGQNEPLVPSPWLQSGDGQDRCGIGTVELVGDEPPVPGEDAV